MTIPLTILYGNEEVIEDHNMQSLPDLIKEGIKHAREASRRAKPVRSNVYVGSSVYDNNGFWHSSANVETKWQHSYHAEENAIIGAVLSGARNLDIVVVSASKKLFTPCGHCCDLVMEFST